MRVFKSPAITRYIALFVTCSIFLSMLAINTPEVYAEEDPTVTNPGFEVVSDGKPTGWTLAGNNVVLNSDLQFVHTGAYSVKITDTSSTASTYYYSSQIPVIEGNMYEASVYCYSTLGNPQLYLEFYNSSNVRIGVTYSTNGSLNNWNKVSVMGVAPQGTLYAKVLLYSGKASICEGYLDDVSLKVLKKELANPSFEQSDEGLPAGWVCSPADAVSLSSEQYLEGSRSLRIEDASSDSGVTVRSSSIPVSPGHLYEVSVYTFTEAGVAEMYIEYYDIKGTRIDVGIYRNNIVNTWKKISGRREAPEGAVYATVLLYANKGNVGLAYFDSVSFNELSKELVNGSFESVTGSTPDVWSAVQGGIIEASTQKVYEGTYSLKLNDSSNASQVITASNKVPVEEGNVYEASVYSYNDSGASELDLEYYDLDDSLLLSFKAANNTIDEWKLISTKGIAPYNTSYLKIKLSTSAEGTGVSYFDNAVLRFVSDAPVRDFPLKETGHPRLYFTGISIQSLRDKADDTNTSIFGISGKGLWNALENSALNYLTETSVTLSYYNGYQVTFSLPPQQPDPMAPPPGYTAGAYPYWTAYSKAIQERIENLSLAYSVTGNVLFAEKAKEYALSVAGWDVWSDSNSLSAGWHTNLDTSHLTLAMSTAYDMLYDMLTEAERNTIENAIITKGLEPLFTDTKNKLDHNIQMLRACALGTGAAVILGKDANASKYLTRATDYYKWYLDMRMYSGQQEGLMYTSYAMENLIRAIDVIARVTGERDLIEHPFINDYLIKWAVYSLIPGGSGLANFSDGSVSSYFYNTMSIAGTWLDNGYAGWYLANAKPSASNFEKFLYYNPNMRVSSPELLETSAVFDEIGWATLRTGWEKDDTMLALISNNSRLGHNHYDQNSIIIGSNNSVLAADPGYQDYSPGAPRDFTLKYGHNTIYVDGKPQNSLGGGVLTEGLLSTYYDYVKGSAANAYSSPTLELFDRHIVNIKPGYYVMLDDLKADTPRTYDWQLYTGNNTEYEIDGVSATADQSTKGNHIYMHKGAAQLAVKFLAPGTLPVSIQTYPGAEGYGPYVKVGSGEPLTEYKFLTVINTGEDVQSGIIKAVDLGDPIDSSGREYKTLTVDGTALLFYKALSTKDYVTLRFNVDKAGEYDLSAMFIKSPMYGKVQVYIDGQPVGGIYDGYNSVVTTAPEFSLGRIRLSEGMHEVKFQVVGRNEASGSYYIGIDSLNLLPVSSGNTPSVGKVNVDAELLQADNVIGAAVENENTTDYVLFRAGTEESYSVNGIDSNADQSFISVNSSGRTEKLAMTRGSFLKYNGIALLTGSSSFSASIGYNKNNNNIEGVIEVINDMVLGIYTGSQVSVLLDGQVQSSAVYDTKSGIVTISVPSGRHNITIKDMEAPQFTVKANGSILTYGMEFTELESVSFSVYASDSLSGVADIKINLDGKEIEADKPSSFVGMPGIHTLSVMVTDAAGNSVSDEFSFTVVTDILSISELIESYKASGDLKGPLVPQLENNLAQAEHQIKIGSSLQAAKHLDDFIKHLTNTALEQNVTEAVIKVLNADAKWLAEQLRMLQ